MRLAPPSFTSSAVSVPALSAAPTAILASLSPTVNVFAVNEPVTSTLPLFRFKVPTSTVPAAVTVPSLLDVPTLSSFAVKEPVTATVPCCKSTLPAVIDPAAYIVPVLLLMASPTVKSCVVVRFAPALTATVPSVAVILSTVNLPASTFIWLSDCRVTFAFKVPPLLSAAALPRVRVPALSLLLPTVTVLLEPVPFSSSLLPSPTSVSPVSLLIVTLASTVPLLLLKSRSLTPRSLLTPVAPSEELPSPTFKVPVLTVPVTLVWTAPVGARSSTVALLSTG